MNKTIISADGTQLAARVSGSGSPLVLVHGANGDLDTFRLSEPLFAARHTVWTYSRRGRGGSGDGPDYCLDREIEDLIAVLAAAGDGAHVVGVSGGAIYALLAAGQITTLRSVTVFEPPLGMTGAAPVAFQAIEAIAQALEDDVVKGLERFAAAGDMTEDLNVVRALPEVWERMLAGARLVPRELRAALAERDRPIERPSVPTLYVYGEETNAPMFLPADRVHDVLPGAKLHGLPRQRHFGFAFDPSGFASAVLEFTREVDARHADAAAVG